MKFLKFVLSMPVFMIWFITGCILLGRESIETMLELYLEHLKDETTRLLTSKKDMSP